MKRRVAGIATAGAVALAVVGLGAASAFLPTHKTAHADDIELAVPFVHQRYNGLDVITTNGDGQPNSLGALKNPPSTVCTAPAQSGANVNSDCELVAPHNETSIVANPTNPQNMIAGANDYQLTLNSGGHVVETIYTRAHASFDGGKTWTEESITTPEYMGTGDPALAFDADGRAYLATLGFSFPEGNGASTNADVVVSTSTDGGATWSHPAARVATSTGTETGPGIFNDKEYIAAWGHGNAIVTYTQFNDGKGGATIKSPIFASVTHDGGKTWTTPVEISGSASFCLGSAGDNACDQDQVSIPTVTADGKIFVAFESMYNGDRSSLADGRDQYLVVQVDPQTGNRIAGPFQVAQLTDGVYDYPMDAEGRQTYQDSQFRTWSAGNITADPTNPQHLAVVWSDMRNSSLPSSPSAYNSNPYAVTTNSDVFVSQSTNGGQTWSAPTNVATASGGDQFMPWAAYDANGLLRVGYFDRSYDSANHKFGYTLATEASKGSMSFTNAQLTTTLSDPTQGDRWFSGTTVNSAFPHPSSFIGDYSGIYAGSALSDGSVLALWTDMRNSATFTGRTGASEDAYLAAHP